MLISVPCFFYIEYVSKAAVLVVIWRIGRFFTGILGSVLVNMPVFTVFWKKLRVAFSTRLMC